MKSHNIKSQKPKKEKKKKGKTQIGQNERKEKYNCKLHFTLIISTNLNETAQPNVKT